MDNKYIIKFHEHAFHSWDAFQRELHENQVLYRSNPPELENFYKNIYSTFTKANATPYAPQEVKTLFWRTVSGDIPRITSGLPKLISQSMVNLLVGNGFDYRVNDDDTQTERLKEILDENNFDELLQEAIATESWAGFVYFKISHDLDLTDKPIIEVVSPFDAKCVVKRGRVQEIVFYIHEDYNNIEVEIHERYYLEGGRLKVEYKAYNDGEDYPLPDKYLEYETDYPLTFIPAMLKNNTGQNSRFPNYPYGESDYTSVQALFHMLDDLLSQTELEVSNGLAQKFVNQKLIPKQIDGRPYKFDKNQTIVEMTSNDMEDDSFDVRKFISIMQPDIRIEKYENTTHQTYARILTNVGLSPTTVGLPNFESIDASANSQREREKTSLRTRSRKLKMWKPTLVDLFERVLMYDDYLNNRNGEYEIEVEFLEYGMPSREDKIDIIARAVAGNVMSIEQAIKELYPEMTPEEQNQMVVDIKLEQGVPLLQQNITPEE
jgi:hypothetical protein